MESFEAVYEELFPQVYRYLLVLCGDRDLAEELTQETFFQAIQHIDSFRGDCKLYVWLCQIGKRKYLAGLRRQKRSGEPAQPRPVGETAAGPGIRHGTSPPAPCPA